MSWNSDEDELNSWTDSGIAFKMNFLSFFGNLMELYFCVLVFSLESHSHMISNFINNEVVNFSKLKWVQSLIKMDSFLQAIRCRTTIVFKRLPFFYQRHNDSNF